MTDQIKQASSGTEAEQQKTSFQELKERLGNDVLDILGRQTASGSDLGDVVVRTFERSAGYPTYSALAFGYSLGNISSTLNTLNNLLKEINDINDPNSPICKIQLDNNKAQKESDDITIGLDDAAGICINKSSLYKASKAVGQSGEQLGDSENVGDAASNSLELIGNILNLISELSSPADPADCINPYFDQFFNIVPIQFIISKLIKDAAKAALAGLSDQDVQNIINDVQPCGSELTKIYNNNLDIPQIPFPLFKLPAIPTIPNVNLFTIVNKLFVELVCFSICLTATKLISWSSLQINKFLEEYLTGENIGAGSYTEFLDKSLGKLNLNDQIIDEVLKQALVQKKIADYRADLIKTISPIPPNTKVNRDGFWRDPTPEEQKAVLSENILLIREYFDEIFVYKTPFKKKIYNPEKKKYEEKDSFRELGTKELLFLMLGQFNCFTIQDLIEIGSKEKFKKLKLDKEQAINTFFTFIGNDIDPIEVITNLKKNACPPDPCQEIENQVLEEVQNRIGELCQVLNVKKSGLPPIPVTQILKALKLDRLFNDGVKEQFKQLKREQLTYLGFPSLKNFPTPETIRDPFLPNETGNINDYEISQISVLKNNEKLLRQYFLRGGPSLKWKYDDVNIDLAGSSLDDFCGEDETLEETFIHIFNDVFKLDFNKIQSNLETKKEEYKESFKASVNYEFDVREGKSSFNPCCKFKNLKFTIEGETDDNKVLPYLTNADVSLESSILVNKIRNIYNATDLDDLEAIIYTLINQMTDEEKCYVCGKPENIKEDKDSDVVISLIDYLGQLNDLNQEEFQKVLKLLECEKFGYVKEGQAVVDFSGPAGKKSLCK